MVIPAEQSESSHVPAQPPLRALDYEPPQARRGRGWNAWIGISAALFLAFGTGLTVGGAMLAQHVRDEVAITLGFGSGSLVLGATLGVLFWLRHSAR